MISNQPFHISGGRLALGIVLAMALGLLTPLLLALEACFLMPVLVLSGVMMIFLYGYAGRVPAWLYMTVQLGATAALFNSTFMWMTMAAGTFPAILAMRGIIMKRPFFEQLKTDVGLYLAGLVVAVLIVYTAYGGNIIGRAVDGLTEQFKHMPDLWFQPFVDAINRAFSTGETQGISPIDIADYRTRVLAMLQLVGETYERVLPGNLLAGSMMSGVVTVLWGNWLMARRGMATNESFIGMERWFLPRWATLELLLLWIIAYFISESEYASAEAVYMAAYAIVSTAFMFQGLAAINRFCYRRSMTDRKRRVLTVLGLVFGMVFKLFNSFLFILGALSALFGSHGSISIRISRGGDDDDDDDDE